MNQAQGPDGKGTPQEGADLLGVAGLDSADGLRRVAGNARLYGDLLRQFAEGQAHAADRIRECLGTGEGDVAERLAHTVKGVAGTVGATKVRAVAGRLETAIREGAEAALTEALRVELDEAVTGLVRSLGPFLARQAAEAAKRLDQAPPVEPGALQPVLERMILLLEGSDAAAIDCLASQRALFGLLFAPEALRAFEQQVNAYAFEEAASELRRAAVDKGI